MTFEQILPAFKSGSRIRRTVWHEGDYWQLKKADLYGSAFKFCQSYWGNWATVESVGTGHILADDWEVMEAQ